MSDYDEIKETIFHYFEGYQTKDRARLERAFATDVAHMTGYVKNEDGQMELWSKPIPEMIDLFVSDDDTLPELAYGKILAIHIFSDVAATALFDCAGAFIDTFQMVKLNGEWRIANKFYVDY
jgi:hypothetical protein